MLLQSEARVDGRGYPLTDPNRDDSGVAVQEAPPKLAEPPRYQVWIHNDDYSTMEFVVEVLTRYFKHTQEQAVATMMAVHQSGKGIAGTYTLEIAETKVAQVQELARERGYPLRLTIEPTGG